MCAFFAVDLATGQEMVKSISQMQADVETMVNRLAYVDRTVNLGDLEEARAVASFNQMVASDGSQSARVALEKFRGSLNNAAAAVRQGMINYQEVEAATEREQQRLRGAGLAEPRPHGPVRLV